MNSNSSSSGQVRITHVRDGKVITDESRKNLIVTSGKKWQAARQKTVGQPAELGWMACGTGTTAPAMSDATLENEIGRVVLATSGGYVAGNTVTYQAAFNPGVGTGPLTEVGLFNAAVGGTMVSRVTFPVKNKEAGDTITITWSHSIN